MASKKKQNKVEFTQQELDSVKEMVDYFVETIAHDLSSSGYKHPGDIQAWGQDIAKYGIVLEKIAKLKGNK